MAHEKSKKSNKDSIADSMLSLIRIFRIMSNEKGKGGVKLPPLNPQYWILGFLKKGDLTMSDLGAMLHRSKPNMTAIIGDLIGKGLVVRKSDKEDRRVVKISITGNGRKFLALKKQDVKICIQKNISSLSKEDTLRLGFALDEINRIISKIDI